MINILGSSNQFLLFNHVSKNNGISNFKFLPNTKNTFHSLDECFKTFITLGLNIEIKTYRILSNKIVNI